MSYHHDLASLTNHALVAPVALVTGSAKRLGRAIAQTLHHHGWRVIIHYHSSEGEAQALCHELNLQRPNSAAILPMNLLKIKALSEFAAKAVAIFGRLDALINNAAIFYGKVYADNTLADWDRIMGLNCQVPLLLSQYFHSALSQAQGVVINIGDALNQQKSADFLLYQLSKASLHSLTTLLAKAMAPQVRVHAVLPGRLFEPNISDHITEQAQQILASQLSPAPPVLAAPALAEDVAKAVLSLLNLSQATGQILAVDAGMSL